MRGRASRGPAPSRVAVLLWVVLAACNAFDDPPPDDGFDLPAFGQPGRPAVTGGTSGVAFPTMPPPPTVQVGQCLDQPGLSSFTPGCAECLCAEAPQLVSECRSLCFSLLNCVFTRCADDPSDINCAIEQCSDLLGGATEAMNLGTVIGGACLTSCEAPADSEGDGGQDEDQDAGGEILLD